MGIRMRLIAFSEDEYQSYSGVLISSSSLSRFVSGHDFSRAPTSFRRTQVDENASAPSAPEGPKENSPGQAKRSPGKGQQKNESPGGATEMSRCFLRLSTDI